MKCYIEPMICVLYIFHDQPTCSARVFTTADQAVTTACCLKSKWALRTCLSVTGVCVHRAYSAWC